MEELNKSMGPVTVPLDPDTGLRRDPDAWPRASMDGDRVAMFMDLFAAGGPGALPPIRVVRDVDGTYLLGDGWTRVEAAIRLGWQSLPAVVDELPVGADPVQSAYVVALETAATTARPLSRRERQTAIERLLTDVPNLSDREIGRLVGVAHTTVGRMRRQLDGIEVEVEPEVEPGVGFVVDAAAVELAGRLFRAMDRVYEARGLGFQDAFLGDRTAHRLADALTTAFAGDALERATRYRTWIDGAIKQLRRTA